MMKKMILCLGLINITIFLVMFKKPQKKQKLSKYDCAIVCGYPAKDDGSPSLIMKSRVEKAVELYKSGKVKYIIFSGGNVKNQYIEAIVMNKYAQQLGVNKTVMIDEIEAKCTYHNMLYAAKLMKMYNLKNALVITNSWHLRKADHYARKFKLDYAMITAKHPKNYHLFKILFLHLYTNLVMYRNMFKGYY